MQHDYIISLIVAYSDNRVIGIDNELPWRLACDLAHFKKTTMGAPIIMGRKTWQSLGRTLPGRSNIVISRDADFKAAGAEVVTSLEQALTVAKESFNKHTNNTQTNDDTSASDPLNAAPKQIFIIGGAQIYELALPIAQRVYATEVHTTVNGHAFFPTIDKHYWQETERRPQPSENNLTFDFVVYEKKTCNI